MAGRPKKNLVIKEIEEVKESPIEKEAVDISEPKKETTFNKYKEEVLKDPEFKKVYDSTPIRTGVVKDCNGTWLNVRKAPFSDIIVGKLNNGDKVDIYEIDKGYAKISATEDKWVSVAFIG